MRAEAGNLEGYLYWPVIQAKVDEICTKNERLLKKIIRLSAWVDSQLMRSREGEHRFKLFLSKQEFEELKAEAKFEDGSLDRCTKATVFGIPCYLESQGG